MKIRISLRLYVALVALAAGGFLSVLALSEIGGGLDRPWLIPLFAALIVLEHFFETRLVRRGEQGESYSHEESFLVAMAMVASPLDVLLTFAIGFLVGNVLLRRPPLKTLFNVSLMVVSAGAALLAAAPLGGAQGMSAQAASAALVAGAVYLLVNRVTVSAVLALAGAGSWRENAFDDLRGFGLISAGNISLGLLAGLAAAAHEWALAFGVPAMVALHFAFSGHVRARAERQKLADLVDATSDGIVWLDRHEVVCSWNPASERITGYAAGRIVGRDWQGVLELLRAEPEPYPAEVSELYDDREQEMQLLGIRGADGEPRSLALSRAPLPEGGWALVLRDETTRRQIDEMLAERKREQMRADLVASVSHELRTPLTSILGFAQTLLAREPAPAERARYLEIIRKEASRLKKLIDNLLDLRAISEGRLARSESVDLAEVLTEQVELFSGESGSHRLVIEVPSEPLQVTGDRDRLSQVASNLISNAIKYSPGGGEVRVSARSANGAVHVAVRDTGLGISQEHRPQIFTRFFRADVPSEQRIGGSGLGLALSREIVEAHGGRIGFESAEGEGSTFYFELPAE